MASAKTRLNLSGNATEDTRRREQSADLEPFLACPFLRGVSLKDVEFDEGTVRVAHKLGKKPQGWWVTRSRGSLPAFYEESSDATHITFLSEAEGTFDLWVF